MDRKEVMDFFNNTPRIGSLSTTDSNGNVNAAIFGSPQMINENTVVMGIGKNRTFLNLLENPKAVFLVVEPGESVMGWKGFRVYLEVETIDKEGDLFDQIKIGIARGVGEDAANMIHAAVRFTVTDIRNLFAPP